MICKDNGESLRGNLQPIIDGPEFSGGKYIWGIKRKPATILDVSKVVNNNLIEYNKINESSSVIPSDKL